MSDKRTDVDKLIHQRFPKFDLILLGHGGSIRLKEVDHDIKLVSIDVRFPHACKHPEKHPKEFADKMVELFDVWEKKFQTDLEEPLLKMGYAIETNETIAAK